MKPRTLFGSERMEWLKLTGATIRYGDIWTTREGRIKFKGRRPARVAVKALKDKHATAHEAFDRLREMIPDLYRAGVNMPKIGVLEHEGRPVLVSSLFANARRTKLTEVSEIRPKFDYDCHPEFTAAAARQLGLMAKAGWQPITNFENALHALHTADGLKPFILDLEHCSRLRDFSAAMLFFRGIRNQGLQQTAIRTFYAQLQKEKREKFIDELSNYNCASRVKTSSLALAIARWRTLAGQ